ncbi:efflux RND transporter periplasmic adaptor subunit [Neobacillus niacini]|uniref:efflux RND transporter periplasmic adaptor subunit n=1 Tax=Neobacillus niacini TaxID=86668 RepID=UPI003983266F
MKKKTWIMISVISLVIIMISVSVYREVYAKGPSVETTEMKEEEISSLLMIPGTVKLEEEQIIYPSPEKGELKELLVSEGQEVKKGTVVARLQNPQLDLEMEQYKLSIESANLKINQLDKQLKQLKEKEKSLANQVGKEEAKKQLDPEYQQIEMEKKLANIELKQTNLQKEMMDKRLSDLEIISTIDGVVLSVNKLASSSLEVSMAEPIVHIGKLDNMIAMGLLSEYDTMKVNSGQKVVLRSDAVPDQEWTGEIIKISLLPEQTQTPLQGGSQAVQYPVTTKISGDSKSLKPGFQIIMEIETDKKIAHVLSLNALHDDGEQPYVFIVQDGKASKKNIKTGITSGEKIEIMEGLSKEDKIIIKGPDSLKDGMDVTIK